jgi:1-deoxy-D-xylulose-5-phosphate synthase
VKGIDHPIVLHINTEKGHGYEPAVENKEAFHWHSPFDLATGESAPRPAKRSYTTVLNDYMEKQIQVGQPIVAINAGIPGNNNLQYIEKNYPDHYLDAGIAEQFTITYGGAAALGGARPFIFHSSTFVQRAYDQFWHDLAINKEPAIVIVKGMSISASDETHQGSSALTWLSNIPNLNVLTPTSEEELVAILDWAMGQHTEPVVIVLPEHGLESRPTALTDFSTPKFTVAKAGSRVAVLGLGGLFAHAEKVVAAFTDAGIDATLVNPIFASQLDAGLLDQLAESHDVIVTMEDGIVEGGFGPKVAAYLGSRDVRVLTLGAAKEFNEEVPVAELYERYHLTPEQVVADVKDLLD